MNDALSTAIREAYAACPRNVVVLETLEVRHASLATPLYLVRALDDVTATLETSESVTFRACGFSLSLPATGPDGLQELTIVVDNTDRAVSDFLLGTLDLDQPVELVYRPYLATDLTGPEMDPPLRLEVRDATIGAVDVTVRATFHNLQNAAFPREYYSRQRFPALG